MKEVILPSKAVLKIQPAPFADSKALYMTLLEEAKTLKMDPEANVDVNLFKDIFCVGFSSKKVEAAVWKCMEKCLYNDMKILGDTFEPESAREDYMTVMFEVAQENIRPFTKSLYAQFKVFSGMMASVPA